MRTGITAIGVGVMLISGLGGGVGKGTHSERVQASATAHGFTLTLVLPRDRYPRGALVRTTVFVKNNTRLQANVGLFGCNADGPSPIVQVLNAHGHVAFPPALPDPPLGDAGCVEPVGPEVPPGGVYSQVIYVALRGSRLRAEATVAGAAIKDVVEVRTPPLRVSLGPADAPTIGLTTSPAVGARVSGSQPKKGDGWYYTDWYVCGQGTQATVGGQTFAEEPPSESGASYPILSGDVGDWTRTSRSMLPDCAFPQQWHVAIGRLGHSVAYLNYGAK